MASVCSNLKDGKEFADQPGEWAIRTAIRDGHTGMMFWFGCPNEPGKTCAVPLAPLALPNGASWKWDGKSIVPTLTPSINCVGGCGWHGHVKRGQIG